MKGKKRKNIARRIIIFLFTLLVIYFGVSIFFTNHLYFGTEINGINVSGKTVTVVKAQMMSALQTYTLNLKYKDGGNEQINGEDIGLKYDSHEQFENLKEEQNPLKWISSLLSNKSSKMTVEITYKSEALKERLDKLSCFDKGNIIEPENPHLKYVDNGYVIIDEIKGNKVSKDILFQRVTDAISKLETTIDLESTGCYINPEYNSKSQKVREARDTLNKYLSSKITYTCGDSKEILDGSTINKWLTVDNDFKVILDEGKVKEYIESLSNKYNTVGKTRGFVTSSGKTISISGGDYGRQVNTDKETKDLIAAIKEGHAVIKEPAYIQTAAYSGKSDIGNTYVEIDMTKQHLWYYKNGSLVVQGDVVTGNISLNNATPEGIYRLKYKEKNATLKGKDYSVPVTFWMPFNGNIGIHDATWRDVFGGDIYKTNGSHGCVNSPYTLAQTIYNNIDVGTAVICYR